MLCHRTTIVYVVSCWSVLCSTGLYTYCVVQPYTLPYEVLTAISYYLHIFLSFLALPAFSLPPFALYTSSDYKLILHFSFSHTLDLDSLPSLTLLTFPLSACFIALFPCSSGVTSVAILLSCCPLWCYHLPRCFSQPFGIHAVSPFLSTPSL